MGVSVRKNSLPGMGFPQLSILGSILAPLLHSLPTIPQPPGRFPFPPFPCLSHTA